MTVKMMMILIFITNFVCKDDFEYYLNYATYFNIVINDNIVNNSAPPTLEWVFAKGAGLKNIQYTSRLSLLEYTMQAILVSFCAVGHT